MSISLELEALLDYEIRGSMRYRRPMSLVLVAPVRSRVNLRELLGPILRASDKLFQIGGHAAILMGETDRDGALTAIRRYKEACNDEIDLRFALASFPDDGTNAQELIATARRRLGKALACERGAVIASE
jgi:hypothetical protein